MWKRQKDKLGKKEIGKNENRNIGENGNYDKVNLGKRKIGKRRKRKYGNLGILEKDNLGNRVKRKSGKS